MEDTDYLKKAIESSEDSVSIGGFPVGAVVVKDDEIIATGVSNGKQLKDPTSHAEIAAIRNACQKLDRRDLPDVVLYSSLEPCLMCLCASSWSSIKKVVYACGRDKVSKQHYEGGHDLQEINQNFRNPIEVIHMKELENEALGIIQEWEESIK